MKFMKFSLFFFLSFFSLMANALDSSRCSSFLNNGMWKRYKYMGIDNPVTKATKNEGISKGTFVTSSEQSTGISDPKYWTNVSSSSSQGTSSWGDCRLLGLNNLKNMRDNYFNEHAAEIFADISKGDGHFLSVLSSFSLCDQISLQAYNLKLRQNIGVLTTSKTPIVEIDSLISNDEILKESCYVF
ncbi:MAG: hypothetical protein QE271_00955 [Bacteriovoracaceae bacterium]|nr:hypothetical protein [Bacteriovoracaceae bacterium]